MQKSEKPNPELYEIENQEWLDSLEYILQNEGPGRAREILTRLTYKAREAGVSGSFFGNTPYINTIPAHQEVPYPGDLEIENKLKSIIRWNAMAMVVKANRESTGIGGHISTYASMATLFEVGFNHFFRGGENADLVFFQGHASPGVYARSFLENIFDEESLLHFRRELTSEKGLSSYPHPRLMPDYWRFPTVSMGLAPIQAIYQARFSKYLEDRELKEKSDQKIWAFLGDGEMDEPESMGALTVASREELNNLIFVVNCNLQRLDGPVRGNGKIIQELEAAFQGAGWKTIKVIWGSNWDPLLENDSSGKLVQRMEEAVDGEYQKFVVEGGAYVRKHFFGKYPELEKLVEDYSDQEIGKLRRGGHDPVKVYNAFKQAVEYQDGPVVVLAKTIKGYGLGEAGEGRNVTHQQKKLNEDELLEFRKRFNIPLPEDRIAEAPFYKPPEDSDLFKYLMQRREELGGHLPLRQNQPPEFQMPDQKNFDPFLESSEDREVATTMVLVQLLGKLLKDKTMGKLVVPIVPDESRTFGMDALFRQVGIYSHVGQKYEPVDKDSLLYYREARKGAILEEGITEAGSMASFIAAGTAHINHGIPAVPFFIFYSMFGFQRVGDLIWAACDARARGFLVGGTSGRTTLAGEGLQHQDGQSHLYALAFPNLRAYDPAFAYELAVIVQDGFRRMYQQGEDLIYYLTVMNEKYSMPAMPKGVEEGILQGMYLFRKPGIESNAKVVHLFGSGAILNEVIRAAEILEKDYEIPAEVWSVTSYKALYDDAIDVERKNRLQPEEKPDKNYLETCLEKAEGVFVAAHDYAKAIPLAVSRWVPGKLAVLGTDGFGRSDDRTHLRDFFEVDARHIVYTSLYELVLQDKFDRKDLKKAAADLKIDPEKANPRT